MSSDPWALAASCRQRRHWRHWPWGWMALGLSLAAWACLAVMAFLVTASIGMPGDGNHAMQATRVPMFVTLWAGALVALGGFVASPVAFSLRRQPGAAAMGLALLLLLLLLSCLSLLGLKA
ncbi:hypothetical protein [Xanthomonas cannabis]|uniref:hypothetical protein n=1 Tax=Xanthomonas cannabis TaxID=1885674 RepID=UPI0009D64F83|nr:hypothetical protein [Xanthomonas cannabis]